jgi:hypothetical protein
MDAHVSVENAASIFRDKIREGDKSRSVALTPYSLVH